MTIKTLITTAVAVAIIAATAPAQTTAPDRLELLGADTTVNGYSLSVPLPNPFSPVIEAIFNLPDTSTVRLVLTDTLSTDSLVVISDSLLPPGLYRIPYGPFAEYSETFGDLIVDVHIKTESVGGGVLGRGTTGFRATRRIALLR